MGADNSGAGLATTSDFGSLSFQVGVNTSSVIIHEDSSVNLVGANDAGTLHLSSDGGIADTDAALIVNGSATFLSATTIQLAVDSNGNGNGTDRDVLQVGGAVRFESTGGGAIDVGVDDAGNAAVQLG